MIEENRNNQLQNIENISEETSVIPFSETALTEAKVSLNTEAQKLISELTSEKDQQKLQAIERQFNEIQRKKQLARVSKLSEVQDMLTDQFYQRIAQRPDEPIPPTI